MPELVLYQSAIVGIDPSEVWDMTLADFNLYLRGLGERMRMEQENLVAIAHTQAAMTAQAVNGKLKRLDTYLKRESKHDISYSVDKARELSSRIDKAKGEVE